MCFVSSIPKCDNTVVGVKMLPHRLMCLSTWSPSTDAIHHIGSSGTLGVGRFCGLQPGHTIGPASVSVPNVCHGSNCFPTLVNWIPEAQINCCLFCVWLQGKSKIMNAMSMEKLLDLLNI